MRRAAILAAGLLLPLTAAGCSLDSANDADSLGRATRGQAAHAEDAITLQPEVDGAPTIEFFAPIETEYEVTGPTTVKPGPVNISLTSEGNHNLALAGPGLPVALLWGDPAGRPEEDLTHSVELREGTYTYYCSVPGHRSAGMLGTIEVTSTASTADPTASAAATAAPAAGASATGSAAPAA